MQTSASSMVQLGVMRDIMTSSFKLYLNFSAYILARTVLLMSSKIHTELQMTWLQFSFLVFSVSHASAISQLLFPPTAIDAVPCFVFGCYSLFKPSLLRFFCLLSCHYNSKSDVLSFITWQEMVVR